MILEKVIKQYEKAFIDAFGQLSNKDLCMVYINCIKEAGDAPSALSAGDLMAMVSEETRNRIINDLNLPMQRKVVPDENPVQKLSDSKTKHGKKT